MDHGLRFNLALTETTRAALNVSAEFGPANKD